MTLRELNRIPAEEATEALLDCCGSMVWARVMAELRPFRDLDDLMRAADEVWNYLSSDDWLDAFAAHPGIGETEAEQTRSSRSGHWASEEQSGASTAGQEILSALKEWNRRYERRFGYIFIVSASGKSAEEMLALLQERIRNDPEDEIRVAAAEQQKITRLRLRKMVEPITTDDNR